MMIDGAASLNQEKIFDQVVNYYENILSEQFSWRLRLHGLSFEVLDSQAVESHKRSFKEIEVRGVLKSIASDKALGLAGFSMAFFQTCWEVHKEDIMGILYEFHESGRFEKSLNAAFIALIPKKLGVVEINNYYPISLVGGV